MASGLLDEEFSRLQVQLLELRSANYDYSERCKRQEREIQQLREQLLGTDSELQKANKIISKSKKAKEVEQLLLDFEGLQQKLMSQEEEFRMQNATLLQELNQIVTTNERLEKELTMTRQSNVVSDSGNSSELRSMAAKNAALQKMLDGMQKKYDELKQKIVSHGLVSDAASDGKNVDQPCQTSKPKFESQEVSLSSSNDAHDSSELKNDEQSDRVLQHCDDVASPLPNNHNPDTSTSSADAVHMCDNEDSEGFLAFTRSMSPIRSLTKADDLMLRLETEYQEKVMLQSDLDSLEKRHKEQMRHLDDELLKVSEKLRKKQENLLQIQEEKERMYAEMSGRLEDMQKLRESDIAQHNAKMNDLNQQLVSVKQEMETTRSILETQIKDLQARLQIAQEQVQENDLECRQKLSEQNSNVQQQLTQLTSQLSVLRKNNDDLDIQLKESQRINQATSDQLVALQIDRDKQILQLQEINKVAEKRKTLLDELAVRYQQESEQHREQIKTSTDAHKAEVAILSGQISDLKEKLLEADDIRQELEEVKTQLVSVSEARGWLERRLKESEEEKQQVKLNYEHQLDLLRQDNEEKLKEQQQQHISILQPVKEELEKITKEKDECQQLIEQLRQEIKDSADDKKLLDKKGQTMVKDMKKQLQVEKRRADKLQERLQELLSDTKDRSFMEDLFRPIDKADTSSLSSWSASGHSKETLVAQSPIEEVTYIQEQENAELIRRLATLQTEKSMLEEKVSHLEESCSAMADDLIEKSNVIEYYVMSRTEHMPSVMSPSSQEKTTLKRFVDFVNKTDESSNEINHKLHKMLEELLIKNMHLQQDLNNLSHELESLRKAQKSS